MYTVKVRKKFRLFARKKVIASHEIENGWLKLISDKGIELIPDVCIRSIVLYPDYYVYLRSKRDQERQTAQTSNPVPVPPVYQPQVPRVDETQQRVGWETQANQEAYRRAMERVNGLQV
jgi:hypothetical protein